MGRAKIINGKWTRNVPWEKNVVWRTDIFKTTLEDDRLRVAEFVLQDGRKVLISVQELRRVLVGGTDHYLGGKIWGPFNIDPRAMTLENNPIQMEVLAPNTTSHASY